MLNWWLPCCYCFLRIEEREFETYRRYSAMSLSKTLYPPLSNGSIQEDRIPPDMAKIVDWDVKHQNIQTKNMNKYIIGARLDRTRNCVYETLCPKPFACPLG